MKKAIIARETSKIIVIAAFATCTGIACMHQIQVADQHRYIEHVEWSSIVPEKCTEDLEKCTEFTGTCATERKIAPVQQYEVISMTPEDIQEEIWTDQIAEMAVCVEAEAGNQGLLGKRMVVDVILNRVDSDEWPDTIIEVIEQPIQFSSFWDGHMDGIGEVSQETRDAIDMELKERMYTDIYYFTAGTYGDYGTPWKKVGDHYFCKM